MATQLLILDPPPRPLYPSSPQWPEPQYPGGSWPAAHLDAGPHPTHGHCRTTGFTGQAFIIQDLHSKRHQPWPADPGSWWGTNLLSPQALGGRRGTRQQDLAWPEAPKGQRGTHLPSLRRSLQDHCSRAEDRGQQGGRSQTSAARTAWEPEGGRQGLTPDHCSPGECPPPGQSSWGRIPPVLQAASAPSDCHRGAGRDCPPGQCPCLLPCPSEVCVASPVLATLCTGQPVQVKGRGELQSSKAALLRWRRGRAHLGPQRDCTEGIQGFSEPLHPVPPQKLPDTAWASVLGTRSTLLDAGPGLPQGGPVQQRASRPAGVCLASMFSANVSWVPTQCQPLMWQAGAAGSPLRQGARL